MNGESLGRASGSDTEGAPVHRSGRRPLTTHAALEKTAIRLFSERGFEATSVDDIASAVGISRRTFFRYFAAKADVVWGDFDVGVEAMRLDLGATPDDIPVMDAVRDAVVRFNNVPAEEQAHHRLRQRLLLEVPELFARSALRYARWRGVVDEFVADRLDQDPEDLLPRTIGHCSLGAALAAYEQWLREDGTALGDLLEEAFRALSVGFERAVAAAR